jgi:hypothetical protein
MIADVTAGWLTTKAIASSMRDWPGVFGDLGQLLDRFELALVLGQRHVEARDQPAGGRAKRVSRRRSSAGQPPAGQRAVGEDAHAVPLGGRQDVELDAADEQGVGRLLGAEPLKRVFAGGPLRLDGPSGLGAAPACDGGEVRGPDAAAPRTRAELAYVFWYSGPSPPSGVVNRPPLAVIAPHWTQFV